MKTSVLPLAAIISCTFSSSAFADDIETITVSSTRQSVAISDTTTSISQLTSDKIALADHEHINQLLNQVPGAWVSRGNGQEHLTAIRSPVLTGAGGCGAFYMAEDGVSLRSPVFCNTNQLFDVNSEQAGALEVIRGPASTLYGTNAVHGVINIISPDAFSAPRAYLSLEGGPHGYVRNKFQFASHSDAHGFLAYGNLTTDDGYKDDSGFDQQKVNLIHQFQDKRWQVKNHLAVTNLNQETAGFVRGFEAYEDPELKRQNPNPEAFRDSKSARFTSQVTYQVDNTTRFKVTPYVRWTDMQFLQHFLPWQPLEENSQQGLGIKSQFEKQFGDVRLLSGFDWDHTVGELTETQFEPFSPTIPQGLHYDYEVTASIYSPFIQSTWQLSPALFVNAGARYEHTEFDYDNKLSDGNACEVGVENCRFTRPGDQTVTFKEWSYQAGGVYEFDENLRLYAQYAKGFRAPQATELFRLQAGQTLAQLEAEELDSIEIGVRGQWQSLSYDVSLFDMQKDNFIFQDTERQNISNGETSHRGAEIALRYELPHNLYVSANATLASHEYDNSITLSREDIQGNEIDTAPEHMGSAQFGWQSDQGHYAQLEWVHQGNYFLNPENTADYSGHNLLNLRARIAVTDQLSLGVRVLNLTDEDYAERADFAFGSYRYFVGEPRSVFFSIHWRAN